MTPSLGLSIKFNDTLLRRRIYGLIKIEIKRGKNFQKLINSASGCH